MRRVSQWNNAPETYMLLLYLLFMSPGMTVHSKVFSIVSNSSDNGTKLKKNSHFQPVNNKEKANYACSENENPRELRPKT